MRPRLSYTDTEGKARIQPWALPLVVIAITVPIVAAFMVGGAPAGLAMGALTVMAILVVAARAKPFGPMEVAASPDAGERLLVLATDDVDASAAGEIAAHAADGAAVRIVVPAPATRLSRWLSAEDRAREQGQDRLARSAGALTAAGLRVSGSVGDSDPVQAVEDELRSFAANEVLFVSADGADPHIEQLRDRLALPLTTVRAG